MPTYHQFIKEGISKESRKCNRAFIHIAGRCVTGPFFVMEVRFSAADFHPDWIHARRSEPPAPPPLSRLCIIKKLILEAVLH